MTKQTKDWCPHIDLVRLSVALSEEVVAASEWEVRHAHSDAEDSLAAAAQEVRDLIAVASGEQDELNLRLVGSDGQRRFFVAL